MNGYARSIVFFASIFATLPPDTGQAQQQVLEPTTVFTARVLGSFNGIVGGGAEGTPLKSGFRDIKEGTSDRTVLEYDLRGQASTERAILKLELTNLDVPEYTTIFLYSFAGNGVANAADYYRIDNFITTFTDNGLASNFIPPYHIPFALDVTTAFNQAVANGVDYLGFVLKNTTAESQYARYRITSFGGLPTLTVGVPEPSAFAVAACCLLSVSIFRRRPQNR